MEQDRDRHVFRQIRAVRTAVSAMVGGYDGDIVIGKRSGDLTYCFHAVVYGFHIIFFHPALCVSYFIGETEIEEHKVG